MTLCRVYYRMIYLLQISPDTNKTDNMCLDTNIYDK